MKLYPAIDLRGGQAVRLYQGDYDRMTVYNADPVAQAQQFIDAGAKYLHVVDLEVLDFCFHSTGRLSICPISAQIFLEKVFHEKKVDRWRDGSPVAPRTGRR